LLAAACALQSLPKVLPLDTLKTFHELGVEPPSTNEDVPKTIAALEAKKKEFEEKRDKAAAEPPSEDEPEPEETPEEAPAEPAAEADKEVSVQCSTGHDSACPAPVWQMLGPCAEWPCDPPG
jgi:hypothetical protein